ncbi:BREX-2 system phosphatase PglZ [Kribbella qitaiheensis]|uniref:BREX-2 system phosphatase PglZ n=1 Tax=Kribbella qitaiheensis TaxID=1544730 RepID=UPI00361D06E1
MSLTPITIAEVRALLDDVRSKGHGDGVVAIQAQPVWEEPPTLDHRGTPVSVVTASSALAVREALLLREPQRWLVILTDRSEADLGLSIRAHLAGQRLHRPDAWAGVRQRFAATRVDHRLVVHKEHRALATGVLALTPAGGAWPPTAGGFLTLDHLCSAVADEQLGLRGRPDVGPDLVLDWSTGRMVAASLADLRTLAGNALTDFVVEWISRQAGPLERAAAALLKNGRVADLVPLGLVAACVVESDPGSGPRALFKKNVGENPNDDQLRRWAELARDVVETLVDRDQSSVAAILDRGDALLADVDGTAFAAASPVLRSGLTERLAAVGEAMLSAVGSTLRGRSTARIERADLSAAEAALADVRDHILARRNDQAARAEAGVRLLRWAVAPSREAMSLADLTSVYLEDLAWVDRAVNDAWSGVHAKSLSMGLERVLHLVRERRGAFDEQFAKALAADTAKVIGKPSVLGVESLLGDVVMPIASELPVLLVVADGMSVAVGTEVLDDLTTGVQSWTECLPADGTSRLAALAVLPTLTEYSRTSLLCGTLTRGSRRQEQIGFERLCKEYGKSSKLFHKFELEKSKAGFALAGEVADAVDDVQGIRIVACVLNTVDDALDRSDPGGTTWTSDMVKHLAPLLTTARRAGRVVVLTADHGHIVERREGRSLPAKEMTSNRSRIALSKKDVEAGEVYVEGSRVMTEGGTAVLAVDELVRYGPMKAGYHGGAAPAEVVVPVAVLCAGDAPQNWIAAPPQAPLWWHEQVAATIASVDEKPVSAPSRRARRGADELPFDEPTSTPTRGLGHQLVKAPAYQRRPKVAGGPTDEQVVALISALATAPSNRLGLTAAATTLGVPEVRVVGAIAALQRLFNVDQYPVLARSADQRSVELDIGLLREQFGLGT